MARRLDSPLHPGGGNTSTAVTKPLAVTGDNLILNVNTGAGGFVRVEVLDSSTGEPISLFADSVVPLGS